MSEEMICVGAIGGAYGVRGEVRIKSFTADPLAIERYSPVQTTDGERYAIVVVRPVKNGISVRLSGVDSKEEADALRGQELFVPRACLPNLPDDEFYHSDLIGLDVVDVGGAAVGVIKAVQNHGAGDLLEVTLAGQSKTVLVPFTKAGVPTVDLTAKRVVIDPPAGVLEA